MKDRASKLLPDVLPALLEERGLSLRALAAACEVDPGFLSRVIRREGGKTASPDLAARIALVLGLAEDYFPETRRVWLFDRLSSDSALIDRVYDQLLDDAIDG